ncbi:MAG: hypothetical protein WKF74_11915 [Pyrinomonadaceae bacterium]
MSVRHVLLGTNVEKRAVRDELSSSIDIFGLMIQLMCPQAYPVCV